MRLVDQSILHDPDNGKYGDCFRACIASVFERPIESIPHFNRDVTGEEQDRAINEWLAPLGFYLQPMNVDADYFFYMRKTHGVKQVHLIFGNTERGTYHSVVGVSGEIVHDPHPSKTGLLPNSAENEWRYVFFQMTDFIERKAQAGEP